MVKIAISLLLVLALGLSGCDNINLPDWLQFGKGRRQATQATAPVVGTVLLSVNSRVVTLEDFNERVNNFNNEIQGSKDIPDSVKENYLIRSVEDKKKFLNEIAKTELLIDEAVERGLDKEKDVAQALKALKEQLLLAKIIEVERAKINVSAKEIENFYNVNQEAFIVPEERRVSMIAVPSEAKAKEILIQLLQGADFAGLAKVNSTDQSAASGGDIGFVVKKSPLPQPNKKTMFEKFEQLTFTLELNKPSAIFEGPNGFYITKVTEIKQARQLLLSEVYSDIEQGLMLKRQDDAINTLIGNVRKVSDIIIHESLLK